MGNRTKPRNDGFIALPFKERCKLIFSLILADHTLPKLLGRPFAKFFMGSRHRALPLTLSNNDSSNVEVFSKREMQEDDNQYKCHIDEQARPLNSIWKEGVFLSHDGYVTPQ